MTDTTPTPDEQTPVETPAGEEKFDFRTIINPEAVAALKAKTPAFAKRILADISALTKEAPKEEVVVLVEPLPEIVTVEDYADEAPVEEVAAVVEESGIVGIFNKVKAKITDPVGTYNSIRKETLPKFLSDVDANILKLEERLAAEEKKNKLDVEFSAKLEDVLEHFKTQATDDSSLTSVIEEIEKKLTGYRLRVLVRHATIPQLQALIKGQRSLRASIASKLSK